MDSKEYYYISTKWTGVNDGFITLWRNNSNGYCWYKAWSGVYNELTEGYGIVPVEKSLVDKLWTSVEYDGTTREALLNHDENLKALGVSKKDLQKNYRSSCPHKKDVIRYIIGNIHTQDGGQEG